MITYLLPILIGYTGGRIVHGQRGAVIGAIATTGVVVGASVPMFLGAMIAGPPRRWVLKQFDKLTEDRLQGRLRDAGRQLLRWASSAAGFAVLGPVGDRAGRRTTSPTGPGTA